MEVDLSQCSPTPQIHHSCPIELWGESAPGKVCPFSPVTESSSQAWWKSSHHVPQQSLSSASVAANIYSSHLMGGTRYLGKQRYPHFWVLGYPSSPSTLWDTSRSTSQHLMPNPTSASTAKIKPNAQHPTSVRSCSKISKTCSYSMSFLLYIKRTHYIYLLLFVAVTNA